MTKTEFDAWKKATANSVNKWQIDPIHNGSEANKRDLLAYKGGEDGHYILIDRDGTVSIGDYSGAIPHIGEAVLTQTANYHCASFNEAVERLFDAGGLDFLRDILS